MDFNPLTDQLESKRFFSMSNIIKKKSFISGVYGKKFILPPPYGDELPPTGCDSGQDTYITPVVDG